MIPAEKIISFLAGHSAGLTTEQVAEGLGAPKGTIAARLSRMADYGKIARTTVPTGTTAAYGGSRYRCIWSAKPEGLT